MRANILVVDDEQSMCDLVGHILRAAGYAVTSRCRVEEVQELIASGASFDLAVLDVVMPAMSGDELARVLRRRDPDAKILFLTGYAEALFQARPVLWEGEAFLGEAVHSGRSRGSRVDDAVRNDASDGLNSDTSR